MRVVNASPLIHLARVSLLDLLRQPGATDVAVVPELVYDEVMRGAGHDPSAHRVEEAAREWLTVVPTPPPHPLIDQPLIDAGEIAVLSVALGRQGATVVLDDRLARREALRLGLPAIGTLRLLLDAKRLGTIPSVRDPLQRLRTLGMRLSDAVWDEVMREAGE
jgi:predicted nucleic acid-binding protein